MIQISRDNAIQEIREDVLAKMKGLLVTVISNACCNSIIRIFFKVSISV